jgi:hypothetical protein
MHCNASNIRILDEMTKTIKSSNSMKKELSKIALSVSILVGVLFGPLATTFASITYEEDFGSVAHPGSLTFANVGWTYVAPATSAPYEGIWSGGANQSDWVTGAYLPNNSCSIGPIATNQYAMIYTVNGATGPDADSVFASFNPATNTPVIFNVELFGGSDTLTPTNWDVPVYFAVLVGGQWYVSTELMQGNNATWPKFTNACMNFTSSGNAWNLMSITSGVSITPGAVSVPSGNITGVGLVQFGNSVDTHGMDYNRFVIQNDCSGGSFTPVAISEPPPPGETVYVGGGVSFSVLATGTPTITYAWFNPSGNLLADGPSGTGSTIIGSATSTLTISNAQSGDEGNYYVVATNSVNSYVYTATSSDCYLTVSAVPSGVLYADTFPYQGPVDAGDLPTATVGWVTAGNNGSWSIWESGNSGSGNVYCSPSGAATVPVISAFYTTTVTNTGTNGLPFLAIPAPPATPYVAFEATVEPNGTTGDNAYFAVQMNGSSWYVSASPMVFNGSGFLSEWLQFTTAASAWSNLTMNANSATIGGAASAPLSGNITGVGLVFSIQSTSDGSFNFNNFEVTSTEVSVAPQIGAAGMPLSQTVYSGAGVSFAFGFTGGTAPFSYYWTLNGNVLANGPLTHAEGGPAVYDGAVVSGATSNVLTITGVTTGEDDDQFIGYVTDAHSLSDNTLTTSGGYAIYLNVIDASIGTIYTEAFPYIGPYGGGSDLESITNVGWEEALPGPWELYDYGGYSAYGAYQANPTTDAFYTSTATDTGLSGLPFPNIVLAGYENASPPLTLSAQFEPQPNGPSYSLSQVTAYWAVQINGSSWYASASPIALAWAPNGTTLPFPIYSLVFSPLAANWYNLTIVPTTSATILGTHPANNLDYNNGVLTGAGVVIVYSGNAGSLDFTDFEINGQGVGNIAYSVTGTTLKLSWCGNPYVQLMSSTSVSGPWSPVAGTLGKYSATVTIAGPQKYYALSGPVADE